MFLLFFLAAALRWIPALSILRSSDVFLVTDDPPYHLLRVTRLIADPPDFGGLDPLIAHPYGAVAHWPWGFDILLAALVRPVVGPTPDRQELAFAASAAIPWLGALAVLLLWWFGNRVTGRVAVLLGAGLLSIIPAHYDYSFFGRVDHHVIEPLIPILALAGPVRADSGVRTTLAVLASGFAVGVSFAFIPAALPIAASSVVVGGMLLLSRRPTLAGPYGLSCFLATLTSLAASPHPFEWVFYSPSLLQVTWMAIVCAGVATGSVTAGLGARSWGARVGGAALGSLVTGTFCLAAIGDFREAVIGGMHYLRGSGFAALSLEAQPLWADVGRAFVLATGLAPFALIGLGRWFAAGPEGRNNPATRRAIGALAILLMVLAVFQRRFLVAASPLLALAMAEGLVWLWTWVSHGSSARRRVGRVALAAVVLTALFPSLRHVALLEPLSAMDRAMTRSARFLREIADNHGSSAGVLAPWSHGRVFQFEADLPTVCDNFYGPPENDAALQRCLELLYERNEAMAATRLRDLRVEYVVIEPPHPDQVRAEAPLVGLAPDTLVTAEGSFRPAFSETLWVRLGLFAQKATPGDRGPAGTRFLGRIREVRRDTGEIEAEVFLFRVL